MSVAEPTVQATAAVRRVHQNDPALTHLLICEPPTTVQREGSHFEITYITDDDTAVRNLCDGIGSNSTLRDVCFDMPLGVSDRIASSACFEGLRQNESIRSLGLSRCELSRGVGLEVLNAFAVNRDHLRKFALWRCQLRFGGRAALSATLTQCKSLTDISLSSCQIDDGMVENIVQAVKGHQGLTRLDLSENNIGRVGCEALSTLLQDANCGSLKNLDLRNNAIDNVGAKAIANGLSSNQSLEAVYLDDNDDISAQGWNSFSKLVCDISSLNATHSSNHTLGMIASFDKVKVAGSNLYDKDGVIPTPLLSLVEMNGSDPDKRIVVRRKILHHHFKDEFSIDPFVESNMDLNVLPHVLAWIGQSADSKSHSALFHLLQEMPELCSMYDPLVAQNWEALVAGEQQGECRFERLKSRLESFFGTLLCLIRK